MPYIFFYFFIQLVVKNLNFKSIKKSLEEITKNMLKKKYNKKLQYNQNSLIGALIEKQVSFNFV